MLQYYSLIRFWKKILRSPRTWFWTSWYCARPVLRYYGPILFLIIYNLILSFSILIIQVKFKLYYSSISQTLVLTVQILPLLEMDDLKRKFFHINCCILPKKNTHTQGSSHEAGIEVHSLNFESAIQKIREKFVSSQQSQLENQPFFAKPEVFSLHPLPRIWIWEKNYPHAPETVRISLRILSIINLSMTIIIENTAVEIVANFIVVHYFRFLNQVLVVSTNFLSQTLNMMKNYCKLLRQKLDQAIDEFFF